MSPELLSTKLFTPPIRKNLVSRSRLTEQLNEGLEAGCKLTLISASAGFGKTTLVSEWITGWRVSSDPGLQPDRRALRRLPH